MLTEIDTNSVAPEKRLEFWRRNIATIFNLGQSVEQPKDLFNARLRAYELGRLRIVEVMGTPHKSSSAAETETDQFAVILSFDGTIVIRQDEREARLEPGELGLCSLERPHTVETFTQFHRITINVPLKELKEIVPACNYITATSISLKSGAGQILLATVKALCECVGEIERRQSAAAAAADAILNLLRGVLVELPQVQEASLSRLEFYHKERIRSFVRSNLRSNLSVESIAKAVSLSPRYVHSLFSKEPMSLMKWVWMERLERCRHDLELPTLNGRSVSEVAYSWGFNDPAHFSRTFRSRFGSSPTEHRDHPLRTVKQAPLTSGNSESTTLR